MELQAKKEKNLGSVAPCIPRFRAVRSSSDNVQWSKSFAVFFGRQDRREVARASIHWWKDWQQREHHKSWHGRSYSPHIRLYSFCKRLPTSFERSSTFGWGIWIWIPILSHTVVVLWPRSKLDEGSTGIGSKHWLAAIDIWARAFASWFHWWKNSWSTETTGLACTCSVAGKERRVGSVRHVTLANTAPYT